MEKSFGTKQKLWLRIPQFLKNTGHWVLEENRKETTTALMNFLCL